MQKIKRTSLLAAFALVPLTAAGLFLTRPSEALHAQGTAPSNPPKIVGCEADTANWLSYPHTAALDGNVRFTQDDAVLKTSAAVALLDKNSNVISAKALGPVHLYDAQDDLTGQHGSVDFTKHLATLRDNIVLVVKPGRREANAPDGSPRRQFKDPATLTCQMMTYDYRFDVGRIPGALTMTQVVQTKEDGLQTRTVTADAGLYNGKAQTVQLLGTFRVALSGGSAFEGDSRSNNKPVLINIKEGAESIFVPFHMQGHFTVKPQAKGKSDTSADEEPDLTLPVPPPHIPTSADAPTASPAPPSQTLPVAPPAVTTPPAQTPPTAAAPTAPSLIGKP